MSKNIRYSFIILLILPFLPTINLNAQCTAHFNTHNDCLYDTINFYDSSYLNTGTITNWEWNFGNGNTSVLQNPKQKYNSDGAYNVSLKITTDLGCMDSVTFQSIVYPIPVNNFTVSYNCPNDSIQFTNTSTVNSPGLISYYLWNFGGGQNLNAYENPSTIYPVGGNYNVTLITSTYNGCVDDTTIQLNLSSIYADSSAISICLQDSALIFGVYQTEPGLYYDSLQNSNGCDSILRTTLIVDSLPTVSLLNFDEDTVCNTVDDILLPVGSPIGGYYTSDGVNGNYFSPFALPPGNHELIYTYSDSNSCSSSDTSNIYINNCTDISDNLKELEVNIYPNPNSGIFYIEKPVELNSRVEIKLLDATLKVVIERELASNTQKSKIDLTNYKKGIYYVQLISNDETYIKKIVKN